MHSFLKNQNPIADASHPLLGQSASTINKKKNRKRKLHLGKKTTLNHRGGAVTQDVGLLPWS